MVTSKRESRYKLGCRLLNRLRRPTQVQVLKTKGKSIITALASATVI